MADVPHGCAHIQRAGQLTPCTPSLCPYATWVNGVGVNRAAYTAITTGLGMINPNVASTFRAAAYAMESLFTQFTYSMPASVTGPWWVLSLWGQSVPCFPTDARVRPVLAHHRRTCLPPASSGRSGERELS